jgi:hypothetical protein
LYDPDTGEVVLDDVLEDQSVDSVVVDIETGLEKRRVATGAMFAAGMITCLGLGRDFYAASGPHGLLYCANKSPPGQVPIYHTELLRRYRDIPASGGALDNFVVAGRTANPYLFCS